LVFNLSSKIKISFGIQNKKLTPLNYLQFHPKSKIDPQTSVSPSFDFGCAQLQYTILVDLIVSGCVAASKHNFWIIVCFGNLVCCCRFLLLHIVVRIYLRWLGLIFVFVVAGFYC